MKSRKPTRTLDGVFTSRGLGFNLGANGAVWSLNPSSALQAHRFSSFLACLPKQWTSVAADTRVLLCAIAYEAIVNMQDLLAFAKETSDRQRLPGGSRVTWISKNGEASRVEARCLSARTELALKMAGDIGDWSAAEEATALFLAKHYPRLGDWDAKHPIQNSLLDASAWLYLHLPASLYSHVRGALSMPVMADSVFKRLTHTPAATEVGDNLSATDTMVDQVNEEAMDKVLDLPSNNVVPFPKKTIAHLKSLCAVSTGDMGIRLADHLGNASAQIKLALSAQIIAEEGWVAATLAAWTTFLLSYGSIRKANPAMSTISAYLNDLLEPLAEELIDLNKTPGMMLQEDWTSIFENLIKAEGTQQRGAALGSLHLWAVRCFGCNPMPQIIFSRELDTKVHANLIWPHEHALALKRAACVSVNERISNQCVVLIALGAAGEFRIGELPSLRTMDIRETADGLRVEIDPGRGTHGGKSRAARRVVHLHDPEAIRLVLAWRDRRDQESKFSPENPVLLFGDPNQAHKLYRFGHCARLINDILKASTGDYSTSFHTLRHSSATYRAYGLLTKPLEPNAVSPLHTLCHEIGHASATTLWDTYFHLPEYAIRLALDRVKVVHHINSSEAAFWLGETAVALRKQSSIDASSHSSDFYLHLLAQKALAKHPDGHIPGHHYTLPALQAPTPTSDAPVTLLWVRQALAMMVDGTDKTAACLRLSCTEAQVKQVCLAVRHVLQSIRPNGHGRSTSLLLDTTEVEHAMSWVHENLSPRHWSFDLAYPPQLQRLVKYLYAYGQENSAVNAAKSWAVMQCKDALSLQDPLASHAFLMLLKEAGFPPQAMVARVQDLGADKPPEERESHLNKEIEAIKAISLEALGTDIRVETVGPRRGFLRRYLMLGCLKFSPDKAAPSAALRMAKVHGLFFALSVFHQLKLTGVQRS